MFARSIVSVARPVSRSTVASRRFLGHVTAPSTLDTWARYPAARLITYDILKPKTMSPRANTFLIDVRGPDEVAHGMIPSAISIPINTLEVSLKLSPEAFQQKFGIAKPEKDQEVTFYCKKGLRSTMASEIAMREGFTNVVNYKGSWIEWVSKEGLQVQDVAPTVMS
ncbi:Rhodanese-like protein [Marasmius fiardii PR-910]|nr:Rhodanese-like protein [Marasmius fiardii PR-910]